jgi:(2Fe-2S) ferredoxin
MKARVIEMGLSGIRINAAGCLNRCELGPTVVVYPDGIWYHMETRKDVDEILELHLRGGTTVQRLLLKADA